MLYEEVLDPPPILLRASLPHPVRTEGDKGRLGTVRCVYTGGDLVKRITAVDPPYLLQFNVVAQCLGIEGCALALGGSYRISAASDDTSDVVLRTHYLAFLRPRWLWRPIEKLLVHQLHRHILGGIGRAILAEYSASASRAEGSPCLRAARGGVACTLSQSGSRR